MPDQALVPASNASRFEHAAHSVINAKRSEHTRKAYRADLERWLEFCRSLGLDPIAPTLDDATEFRDHLFAKLSKPSARRGLASMSAVYRVLFGSRFVSGNPFDPRVLAWPVEAAINKTARVGANVAEAMILVAEKDPHGARDAAILRVLYDTGLRRESVARLRREDYLDGSIRAIVKGGKEVEIRLPAVTVAAIDHWLRIAPDSPYCF